MANCRGCGREIIWSITPDGKKIPLDARAPVYQVLTRNNDQATVERAPENYVTHFATCPKANDFSKGNYPLATLKEER